MASISTACCHRLRTLPNDRVVTVKCLVSDKHPDGKPKEECLWFFFVRRYSLRN